MGQVKYGLHAGNQESEEYDNKKYGGKTTKFPGPDNPSNEYCYRVTRQPVTPVMDHGVQWDRKKQIMSNDVLESVVETWTRGMCRPTHPNELDVNSAQ